VDVEIHEPHRPNIAWTEYSGFWRCAVILDCGKDLPKFVVGKHTLPSQRFLEQIAGALRSPIVEVGEIY
jgi:hypothetical protein